jgi:hypothetical protein
MSWINRSVTLISKSLDDARALKRSSLRQLCSSRFRGMELVVAKDGQDNPLFGEDADAYVCRHTSPQSYIYRVDLGSDEGDAFVVCRGMVSGELVAEFMEHEIMCGQGPDDIQEVGWGERESSSDLDLPESLLGLF